MGYFLRRGQCNSPRKTGDLNTPDLPVIPMATPQTVTRAMRAGMSGTLR